MAKQSLSITEQYVLLLIIQFMSNTLGVQMHFLFPHIEKGIDDIRLVAPRDLPPNNKTAIGRVEILHRGYWGGICDRTHSITQEEASVVCRQVGYRYGYKVKRSTFSIPNQGYGMFWMNGMSCEKDQTDIKDCVIGNLNLGQDTSCGSHYYDLIVICYNTSARR